MNYKEHFSNTQLYFVVSLISSKEVVEVYRRIHAFLPRFVELTNGNMLEIGMHSIMC